MYSSVILLCIIALGTCWAYEIHSLKESEKYSIVNVKRSPDLHIFCYSGRPKSLINVWQSVLLELNHPYDDYNQYNGQSVEAVLKAHEENQFSWSFNLFTNKQQQISLDPFHKSCVGIESREDYSVALNIVEIDYWKVLLLIGGISLFLSANSLSKDTLFYYICGISFGICTSFLILIYFVTRLFPRKPFIYGAVAFGGTVGLYFVQMLWENMHLVLLTYKTYVAYYTAVTGFISFLICYRWGPAENEKTRNIVRWTLQALSFVAIFFSTQFQEAAIGQIITLILFHNVPSSWLLKPKNYC